MDDKSSGDLIKEVIHSIMKLEKLEEVRFPRQRFFSEAKKITFLIFSMGVILPMGLVP